VEEETFRYSGVYLGRVGRTGQESTTVDIIRNFLARHRASGVVRCDTIFVVPVTWDLNVANVVNLLCVFYVPEDEVGVGPDPDSIDVEARRDFCMVGRWFPELCGSANEDAILRAAIEGSAGCDILVKCPQYRSCYPDNKSPLGGELRM